MTAGPRRAAPIAPAPSSASSSADKLNVSFLLGETDEELAARKRRRKDELRKIAKREAAARHNARKSAERKKKRVERERAQAKSSSRTSTPSCSLDNLLQ